MIIIINKFPLYQQPERVKEGINVFIENIAIPPRGGFFNSPPPPNPSRNSSFGLYFPFEITLPWVGLL